MYKRTFQLILTLWLNLAGVSLLWALTDPTQPSNFQQAAQAESLRLESILFSATRKVAVINGKVLSEGDRIESKKIIRISKDSVQLSDGGIETTLTLKRATIRQEK